jgi:hypothetical protein
MILPSTLPPYGALPSQLRTHIALKSARATTKMATPSHDHTRCHVLSGALREEVGLVWCFVGRLARGCSECEAWLSASRNSSSSFSKQQLLYFLPLPQRQGLFRSEPSGSCKGETSNHFEKRLITVQPPNGPELTGADPHDLKYIAREAANVPSSAASAAPGA